MTGPERRLVSAPSGGNGNDGEHYGFGDFHGLRHSVLAVLWLFAEAMGHLDVGTPSFRHLISPYRSPELGRGELLPHIIYASVQCSDRMKILLNGNPD